MFLIRSFLFILSSGDIDDEEELLDWLTDPANMELTEHIERVNVKMFKKIRQTSDYVAVFFCELSGLFLIIFFLTHCASTIPFGCPYFMILLSHC